MKKKYKLGIIFAIVASSILLLGGIVALLALIDYEIFSDFMEMIIDEMNATISIITDMTFEEFYGVDIPTIESIMYIVVIVFNIISILIGGLALTFSLLCVKDYKLSPNDFSKRKKYHITQLVFNGLLIFGLNLTMSNVLNGFSILNVASMAFAIIGLILIVKDMKFNRILLTSQEKSNQNYYYEYTNIDIKPSYTTSSELKEEETIKTEEKPQPQIDNSVDLTEAYELLAKLEKSYKANEISEDDYKRMKQTIIDNYLKH